MRIGPDPAQADLCVFFGHMHVAMCAGWGALRGTGVDAHAVRAHAVRACVLIVQIARAALVRTAVQCVRVCWHMRVAGCGVGDLWHWRRRACCAFFACLAALVRTAVHGGFSVGREDGSMVGMLP